MRRIALAALTALALAACGKETPLASSEAALATKPAAPREARDAGAGVGPERVLRVLTRNLYLGADIAPAVGAIAGGDPQAIVAATSAIWADVQASAIPNRMAAVAAEIAALEPDLVGLQEVTRWRVADPVGGAGELDFLALLLADLAGRGLAYEVAAVSENFAAALPVPLADPQRLAEVSMLDRDVVLVRSAENLHAYDARSGNYAARVPLAENLEIVRGWASVAVKHRGVFFRFWDTHLEVAGANGFTQVQEAQAAELAGLLAAEPGPAIVVGDLNSDAENGSASSDTRSYELLLGAGLRDLWAELHPDDAGLTCCQAADLRSVVPSYERIDLVLFRGDFEPRAATLVGAEPIALPDTTVRWASDHAGVAGALEAGFRGRKGR